MIKANRVNVLMEASYYEQMVDEACNADYGLMNHFRRTLTIEDCIHAHRAEQIWVAVAELV